MFKMRNGIGKIDKTDGCKRDSLQWMSGKNSVLGEKISLIHVGVQSTNWKDGTGTNLQTNKTKTSN